MAVKIAANYTNLQHNLAVFQDGCQYGGRYSFIQNGLWSVMLKKYFYVAVILIYLCDLCWLYL